MSVMEMQASGVDPAVLAALDRFYDAWRRRDSGAGVALTEASERLLVWGTDQGDTYAGYGHIEGADIFASCPEWLSLTPERQALGADGGMAYAADEVTATFSDHGETHTILFRATHILARQDGEWRIAHSHVLYKP